MIKNRSSVLQKVGFYPDINANNLIHIHCVSVGEFNACKILIDKLLQQNYNILITNTTKTGFNACREHYNNKVYHLFFPFDLHFSTKRFLITTKPMISLIFETEIWPNYTKNCQKLGIKLGFINARLSEKSFNGYYRYKKSIKKVLANFIFIATQNQQSSEYFELLGANNIITLSSIKFDLEPHLDKNKINNILQTTQKRKFVVCSSTHSNEEERIIQSYLRNKITQLLVIIPRHPERFKEVEQLLIKYHINYQKQSNFNSNKYEVLLVDKMGWLLEFYSLCDVAFVGGSLMPTLGGHNILEPIALNKFTITGQNTTNFKIIVEKLKQNHGLIEVKNADEIMDLANSYHLNSQKYQTVIDNSYKVFKQHSGASNNIIKLIKSYL